MRVVEDPNLSNFHWKARASALALLVTTACPSVMVGRAERKHEIAKGTGEIEDVAVRFDRPGVQIEFLYYAAGHGLKLLCWGVTQTSTRPASRADFRDFTRAVQLEVDRSWGVDKPTLLKIVLRRGEQGWIAIVEPKYVDPAKPSTMLPSRGTTAAVALAKDVGRAITEALSHNAAGGDAAIVISNASVATWAIPLVGMSSQSVAKPPESFDREISDSIASLQRWRDHGQLILQMRALQAGEQRTEWRVVAGRDMAALKEIDIPVEMCGGASAMDAGSKRP